MLRQVTVRARRICSYAVMVSITISCTSNDTATTLGTALTGVDGPALITTVDNEGTVDEAIIEGVLVFENDCLYLEELGGFGRHLILWPEGSKWQANPPGVIPYPGLTVTPGMKITAGGGYKAIGQVSQHSDAAATEKAKQCSDGGGQNVALIQTGLKEIVN